MDKQMFQYDLWWRGYGETVVLLQLHRNVVGISSQAISDRFGGTPGSHSRNSRLKNTVLI